MRKILNVFTIIIFASTAFFSCKNENSEQIDDLLFKIQSHAKADENDLATLDSIGQLKLTEEQKAHRSLLKIRAYWLMGRLDEPDSDTLIKVVSDYYENSRDYYMKAKAYYILFRIDYDVNNGVDLDGTNLLLKGLKAINKAKKVDSRIVKYSGIPNADEKLVIEYQKQWIMLGLANSYRSIGRYDDVLSVTTEAVDFFEKHGIDVPAFCYNQIGICHFINGNDSCAYYCKKALDLNMQTDDYAMISNSMFFYGVCFRKSNPKKAIEIYKEANRIAYENNVRQKYDAEIGQLYFELKDYDSALYYTGRALQAYNDKDSYDDILRNIYRTLFKAYMAKGDYKEAATYANRCISIFYKSREKEETVVAFENYRKETENENRLYAKKVKVAMYMVFAVSIIAIALVFTALYQKTMRRKESERMSALRLAMEQKQNVQDNWLANNKVYKKATALENGSADRSLVLSDGDWKEFVIITNIVHSGFVMKLKELHPSLTESDIEACCCSRYGFSDSTIAALCGIEIRSFKRHRQRIMEKLGGEKGFHEIMKEF
ncbi:MAG: hypothetical protein MJZ85_07625 [Bacteroidales bacterium]|nr:hypothetical protein [Bacteroidales bacterium]